MSNVVASDLKRRSAISDDPTVQTYQLKKVTYNNSTPQVYASGSSTTARTFGSYVGWNIPNFHRRVREGELLPHTPWTKYTMFGSNAGGTYEVITNTGDPLKWTRYYSDGPWPCGPFLTEDQVKAYAPDLNDKLVQEAAAAIYSSGFDILTFLAELSEVRGLFFNTAKTILKLKVPKNWKSLSNEWLSVRYGWRPLINDFKSINKAIKALNEKQKARSSKRIWNKFTESVIDEYTVENYELNKYDVHVVKTYNVQKSICGAVTADIEIPAFQANPFVSAWELVPLSFVLDWFISVGKSIAAASFMAFQSRHAASKGLRIEVDYDYAAYSINYGPLFKGGTGYNAWSSSHAMYECRVPCSVPLTPHFTLKLNPYKLLDLLGLIIQRYH